jgi:hypothetical protein
MITSVSIHDSTMQKDQDTLLPRAGLEPKIQVSCLRHLRPRPLEY